LPTIDVLTKTEEENNRTVQELREKQKQLQTTNDDLTKTVEANNRTIQELREKQKQLQTTIDCLTKTMEALNQTVQLRCLQPKDVSACKVETVSTSEGTEIPPAPNIANFGLVLLFGRPTLFPSSRLVSVYS
jgi:FtsZ-binding cell division protein ZapB